MTNINISIDDEMYEKMQRYTKEEWNNFIKMVIKKKIEKLELDRVEDNESMMTMLSSEEILKKEWDNEEDERWNEI